MSNLSTGYIMLSRSITESSIYTKPPLYLKVWIYLLTHAQHRDYKGLKRGQLFTSGPEIMANTFYYVGARKVTPTRDQIHQILDWMRKGCEGVSKGVTKAPMIAITKATHGMLVTICNYSTYQDSINYESNGESNNENFPKATRKQSTPDNINKNEKNVKNGKNKYNEAFEQFWELYPRKVSKKDCNNIFSKLTPEQIKNILAHLPLYIPSTKFYYNPKNYLKGEHWNDEIIQRNCESTPNKQIAQSTNFNPGTL